MPLDVLQPVRLIVLTLLLDVPTFTAIHLSHPHLASDPGSQSRREMADSFCRDSNFHRTSRDLLHAVNQRHGTHGFTSLPKEGTLGIFSPWKIRRLRLGLNPRTWVPKASRWLLTFTLLGFSQLTWLGIRWRWGHPSATSLSRELFLCMLG
jgi:hypothetical protein